MTPRCPRCGLRHYAPDDALDELEAALGETGAHLRVWIERARSGLPCLASGGRAAVPPRGDVSAAALRTRKWRDRRRLESVTEASPRDVTDRHRSVTAVTVADPLPLNLEAGSSFVVSESPSVSVDAFSEEEESTRERHRGDVTERHAGDASRAAVTDVFEHWRVVHRKNGSTQLDAKRKARIAWALKHYGVEQVKVAIDGCLRSDWHMGRDPRTSGHKYNDLTLIFRDAEHTERFIALATAPRTSGGFMSPSPSESFRDDDPADLFALDEVPK